MQTDVVIIGASAAGLMCAAEAGKRGRRVLVLDHASKPGKKILMSGGGRCNFTNLDVSADNYISHNPHFCKSALSRYTQWDFIARVDAHRILWHERDHGQLFCNDSARDILDMLLSECRQAGVDIRLNCTITRIDRQEDGFAIDSSRGRITAQACVIATGGLSIPRMCASPFGYQVAEQFGHRIVPTRAGLVPFTLQPRDKARFAELAGIAVDSRVSNDRIAFRENILFTHRGLSGPAILQISSYWQPGEAVTINLLPDQDVAQWLKQRQADQPNSRLKTVLGERLPKRLIPALLGAELADQPLQSLSHRRFEAIAESLQHWQLRPNGTEGYRTAEVTLGGVDCDELSSKTLESKRVPGLYFIGEVVDVTGWLGGYNFQWAWSSGWAAGQVI
ncbi:BaiN/RdsA family NAD(P)/FAD-dependent oxidoreductase [Thiohalobacter thiocyanaticus]|uniref:NAD(P)/FAD-dependent oxidoreductase n=1 Tax=Thiohalobacter thiocyanaticus TaxID=585455 RepID=A0A426QLV9_9GAMM|nr:NAD(P)/FAD-dependent oxidoreductase [Thiohalobacter thiocyanaticus]RRQ22750.1 NAD(P)/FAD-dependent oxidoreductase [Thiohalobacter thiocyanaticus]